MTFRNRLIATLAAFALLAPLHAAPRSRPAAKPKPAAAQAAPQPVALEAKSATLTLRGDSSLHKYHSKARKVVLSGQLLPGAADFSAAVAAGGVRQLKAVIPVESLKSDTDGLDKNLYKALKSGEFPEITFEMAAYELKLAGDGGTAKLKGSLTVSGAKKDLQMDVRVRKAGQNLVFSGTQPLKMTDFGIKPPVMMMGLIKCADDIEIEYEVELQPAAVTTAAPAALGRRHA